jgi:hypothetical protein
MKKVLVIVAMLISASAFAATSDIVSSNNQISIQKISTNVDYTESGGAFGSPSGTLDTETGKVGGYAVSLSTMNDIFYVKVNYDRSKGNTNYTGSFQGGTFGSVVTTSGAILSNASIQLGHGISITHKGMLTPYLEYGNHKWDRELNYDETYTHNYYGIGALGQYSPFGGLVLSANVMGGKTVGANMVATSGGQSLNFTLGDSNLTRVGASADYAFTKNFHGNVGVDQTRFQYGHSQFIPTGPTYGIFEPDSKTTYTTVKVGVGYAF